VEWWQIGLIILAFIGAGILIGVLVSYLFERFVRKPEAATAAEEQRKSTAGVLVSYLFGRFVKKPEATPAARARKEAKLAAKVMAKREAEEAGRAREAEARARKEAKLAAKEIAKREAEEAGRAREAEARARKEAKLAAKEIAKREAEEAKVMAKREAEEAKGAREAEAMAKKEEELAAKVMAKRETEEAKVTAKVEAEEAEGAKEAVVEEQLKFTAASLLAEVENNHRIATEPLTDKLLPFQSDAWGAHQYEVNKLPTNLRDDLEQVYTDISMANSIVWVSTEFNRRTQSLDTHYRQLCTSIAERLDRIKPLIERLGK